MKFESEIEFFKYRIWDLKNNILLKMNRLDHRIRSCSFSIDSKQLACGLSDGSLIVLNLE